MELDKIVQVTNIFSLKQKLKIAYDLFFSPYIEFFVPSPLNVLREGKKKKEIKPVLAEFE